MLLFAAAAASVATEPNPPQWPPTVHVIGPESAAGNATVHAVYKEQYADLYTDSRAALLFKPGVYGFDVPVGYYTTVHGLGANPEDVSFVGEHGVHQAEPGRNLIQFWRSAENLAQRPTSGRVVWSVSQASTNAHSPTRLPAYSRACSEGVLCRRAQCRGFRLTSVLILPFPLRLNRPLFSAECR